MVEGDPEGEIVLWCAECRKELLITHLESHTLSIHGSNLEVMLTPRPMRPPLSKISEALDHIAGMANWALGEGFGVSDEVEKAEALSHLSVLERVLGVQTTVRMGS